MKYLPLSLVLLLLMSACKTKYLSSEGPQSTSIQLKTHQKVVPVLIGKETNPVLRIHLESPKAVNVQDLSISTEGTTDLEDIKSIQLYYTGSDSTFNDHQQRAYSDKARQLLTLSVNQQLEKGDHYFWVSYQPKSTADLLHRVDAQLASIRLKNGIRITPVEKTKVKQTLKLGTVVRERGQDGVHTYRIPGLVTTNNGTLVAAYDIRYDNSGDLQGNIDVGISRSTDNGESWQPMQVIMDMGTWGGLPEAQNGIGDPAILVDDKTGTIWVAALWTHGMPNKRAWTASDPGLSPSKTGQLMLVKSEDNGKTWSEPINITRQVKDPEWQLLLQGPGKGITTSEGILVFPAQFQANDGMPYSTIIYSKDHGKTWHIGTGAKPNTTEAQVAELSDGSLMLNMRDNRGGARSVYTTNDLGETWQRHPTSREALIEPVSQASLIRFPAPVNRLQHHWLMFSNPHSTEARKNMMIQLSMDDGMSWPEEHQILLNENRGFGYSCMTVVNDSTVGILYEGVRELYFQKVTLEELQVQ